MSESEILLTVAVMSAVTMVPRVVPIAFGGKRDLPEGMRDWLGLVPAAVLSAMLVPELLLVKGHVSLGFDNFFLWATIPTALVAWRTRNLCLTVLAGMATVAVLRTFFR